MGTKKSALCEGSFCSIFCLGSILGRPVTAGDQDKQHQKKPLWIHVAEVPQLQKKNPPA